jgi:hypothetical protein
MPSKRLCTLCCRLYACAAGTNGGWCVGMPVWSGRRRREGSVFVASAAAAALGAVSRWQRTVSAVIADHGRQMDVMDCAIWPWTRPIWRLLSRPGSLLFVCSLGPASCSPRRVPGERRGRDDAAASQRVEPGRYTDEGLGVASAGKR